MMLDNDQGGRRQAALGRFSMAEDGKEQEIARLQLRLHSTGYTRAVVSYTGSQFFVNPREAGPPPFTGTFDYVMMRISTLPARVDLTAAPVTAQEQRP